MNASPDLGSYALAALALAALALSLGLSAVLLRRRLLPTWTGAPARLVESILGIALLIWLAELLGLFGFLYAWVLVASSLLLAGAISWRLGIGRSSGRPLPAGGVAGGTAPEEASATAGGGGSPAATGPAGPSAPVPPPIPALAWVVTIGVVALVFAHWGLTAKDALDRGIFNFDSLWYHMPFATEIAKSHSVTALHYTDTVFVNWLYPQNSELLHAVGILLTQRDTLSLFLNFGFLALAFLAAWCIGRPYGRGHLTVVAAAIVLECHTLVVREPGAAKNDVVAAALLLAAAAILGNAWAERRTSEVLAPAADEVGGEADEARTEKTKGRFGEQGDAGRGEAHSAGAGSGAAVRERPASSMSPGWALAAAGLAVGMAVGTKSTALAMAAALSVAALALAPAGRRKAAAAWWFLPALAGGGFWYLRNLIVAGNPLPQLEGLGPLSLPHPERLQSGRPDFSIAHYATDTGVWREYFGPGLEQAFGTLWPLVVAAALAGGLLAVVRHLATVRATHAASGSPPPGESARPGDTRLLAWLGAVALFGLLAYVFTPLSAAGAEGDPTGFAINVRYAIPALLLGIVLLPLALPDTVRSIASTTPEGRPPVADGRETVGTSPKAVRHLRERWPEWALLAALLVVLVVTDRSDAVLRDPDRLFGLGLALLFVLIPAGVFAWRSRTAVPEDPSLPAGGVAGGTAPEEASATAGGGGSPAATGPAGHARWSLVVPLIALAVAAAAIGYPLQRDYLHDRFANRNPETSIPRFDLDSAYRWARDTEDARIGLAGTTAGFLQYGFYGTDLSNRVRYLGEKGPHGGFEPIPTCARFRAAVNAAGLDYLVTTPFLNFVEPGDPVPSPEAAWLRGEPAVIAVERSGPVTVWKVRGRLDPGACGPRNAPLRRVPQQPT